MGINIKRIAINTGGGDAPGLNAVIRAVVLSAHNRGWECLGIRDGYNGILYPEQYPQGGLICLDSNSVRGITHLGGTILGTTNKGNPMRLPIRQEDGTIREKDCTSLIVEAFQRHNLDALVAIGGDGSLTIAAELSRQGLPVVGVPKTIDNDLDETVVTFGFDSAVSFATECIDRLHSTAEAHHRVIIVEVMGRYAGWIALDTGVASTADVILIPEIPYDLKKIAAKIEEREKSGRHFSIIVAAEGAHAAGEGYSVVEKEIGKAERLGGVAEKLASEIKTATGKDSRAVVLGHLLRGGTPTTFDRLLSLRFGAAAVRALSEGCFGVMVALDPPKVRYVPLELATYRMKTVPPDCDTILTAREMGTCFGD
jgi:ATP-dependent phosphofructokinase / diphosphate-dependent phosphofructokinase